MCRFAVIACCLFYQFLHSLSSLPLLILLLAFVGACNIVELTTTTTTTTTTSSTISTKTTTTTRNRLRNLLCLIKNNNKRAQIRKLDKCKSRLCLRLGSCSNLLLAQLVMSQQHVVVVAVAVVVEHSRWLCKANLAVAVFCLISHHFAVVAPKQANKRYTARYNGTF